MITRVETPRTLMSRCLLGMRKLCMVSVQCCRRKLKLTRILRNRSNWWDAWRESSGLIWGDEANSTLYVFAIRAFCCGYPTLFGSVLRCLAFSFGDFERYLPPVERWILHDDELAGCEQGLQCLIGLGLCFFSALQPRKAWRVYRRANGLLQLHGFIGHTENRGSWIQSLATFPC